VRVERQVQVKASPQALYEVVMNPRCLERWVTIHQFLEDAPDGQLRKGSTLTQCLKLAGKGFKVRWTVVENEPAKRVVWAGKGPVRSKAKVIYEFAADGDATKFFYANEYDLPGGPLGRMAGPMVKRATAGELDKSLKKLKVLVE
jgi:uncharacterized membrane protein